MKTKRRNKRKEVGKYLHPLTKPVLLSLQILCFGPNVWWLLSSSISLQVTLRGDCHGFCLVPRPPSHSLTWLSCLEVKTFHSFILS